MQTKPSSRRCTTIWLVVSTLTLANTSTGNALAFDASQQCWDRNGFDVEYCVDQRQWHTNDDDTADDTFYYSAKGIVHALANEIFDPPTPVMAWVREDGSLFDTSEADMVEPQ